MRFAIGVLQECVCDRVCAWGVCMRERCMYEEVLWLRCMRKWHAWMLCGPQV